jgi:hypothetical protein
MLGKGGGCGTGARVGSGEEGGQDIVHELYMLQGVGYRVFRRAGALITDGRLPHQFHHSRTECHCILHRQE